MSHRSDFPGGTPIPSDTRNTAPAAPSGCTRRDAIKMTLAAAGLATLFASPITARATPQASQETLDALDDAQTRLDEVQAQLDDLSAQYQELSKKQDETISQIEDVTAQIEATEAEIAEQEEQLAAKQEVLSERVAASYKNGGNETLSILLSATTFDELISNAYYVEKINEADREVIAEIEEIRTQLEQKRQSLEDQKAELEELKAAQAEQLSEMQQKQQETQEILNGLDDEVKQLIAKRDEEILAAAQAEAEAERRRQEAMAGGGSSTPPVLPAAGSGQDYSAASSAQKRVVDSCYYTASPGLGWCAAWVSYVFSNAGIGSVWGNACDMYNMYCTSSDKSALQVGMIIAVSTHNLTSAGRIYGHVGIYIGDDKVMHNVGPIATYGLDQWINTYGTTVTPRWGWALGKDLSQMS
ncbi:CHAP domain-containing protein [uncultured Enorma sp.]|uniref:coiled-coil domain-containing protein n=1 Tax=uncultured Enorma sp. TaxID=1714346 RepID=UPI002594E72F|nr:CHAP domain-containing protein [uncultured Enorma sp.]